MEKDNEKFLIYKAFTLAEVLITLGIIGVVAGMTIPVLMNNIQDAQLKEALKKDISVISQATQKMSSDNGGTLKGLFVNDGTANGYNVSPYSNYLSFVKLCSNNVDTNGCWHADGKWYNYSGNAPTLTGVAGFYWDNGALILKDGTLMLIGGGGSATCQGGWVAYENSGTHNWANGNPLDCNVVWVDVNGFKPPNKTGKDIFALSIREPGIVYPGVYTENNVGLGCAGKVLRGETCP